MRAVPLLGLVLWTSCYGPPASDAAVCRDVITRLCVSRCPAADQRLGLNPMSDCTAQLTTASGCIDDNFKFENRDAFLSCRLPLIRAGDDVAAIPDCNDVDDMFRGCPTMAQFFGGP
jgi:hypothetical protein